MHIRQIHTLYAFNFLQMYLHIFEAPFKFQATPLSFNYDRVRVRYTHICSKIINCKINTGRN